jgi:phosphoglycolate phosphatase-like HAD superfamily hydrolase
MFDFDGTLALVRAGWMPLMLDMMMETLGVLGSDAAKLRDEAEEYVARYTGKDTVHQTAAFASHVASLGGIPQSAEFYKAEFLRRMEHLRSERLNAVETGRMSADRLLVPGSRALLEALRAAGVRIFLASGSEHADICREAKLLRIDHYFEGIFGSAPHSLTKRQLLAHIIATGVPGERILTFGDGRTEIEDTKEVGGTAIGVATDERECLIVDAKKRGWLASAGADYIIPNYLDKGLLPLVLVGRTLPSVHAAERQE